MCQEANLVDGGNGQCLHLFALCRGTENSEKLQEVQDPLADAVADDAASIPESERQGRVKCGKVFDKLVVCLLAVLHNVAKSQVHVTILTNVTFFVDAQTCSLNLSI